VLSGSFMVVSSAGIVDFSTGVEPVPITPPSLLTMRTSPAAWDLYVPGSSASTIPSSETPAFSLTSSP
jgi:hypothetical protein